MLRRYQPQDGLRVRTNTCGSSGSNQHGYDFPNSYRASLFSAEFDFFEVEPLTDGEPADTISLPRAVYFTETKGPNIGLFILPELLTECPIFLSMSVHVVLS